MADDLAFPGQGAMPSIAPPIRGPGFIDVARMERSAIRGRLLDAAQSVLRPGALQHVASPAVFGGNERIFAQCGEPSA